MSSSNLWLSLGAVAGLVAAAAGILGAPGAEASVPDDVVVSVNGRAIPRATYERAVRAVLAERRDPEDEDAVRERVMQRLIDEELLIQAALDLGLAERDPQVRANLSAAAIGWITQTPTDEAEPTEAELEAFYREHRAYFRPESAVRTELLFFSARGHLDDEAAQARARSARERLSRGAALADLAAEADSPNAPVPNGLVSVRKLEQYVGPTVAAAVLQLNVGEVSPPTRGADGYYVARMVERQDEPAPELHRIRDRVLALWVRRADERRMRAFLAARRDGAVIRYGAPH